MVCPLLCNLTFSRSRSRLLPVVLAFLAAAFEPLCATAAAAAPKISDTPRIEIARSALLVIDGTETADALQLRIRHAIDQTPVDGKDVTIAIDGKNQVITREADGSYAVPVDDLRGRDERPVEVVVSHDGIREVLNGKAPPPQSRSATGILGDHKQLAWWILNIVILLVGAMALSRRKSY